MSFNNPVKFVFVPEGNMNKIAVLSDIHGNIAALETVANDIKTRQVGCVFNLGDPWPKETIRYLMAQDWIQVKGNHDRQLVDQSPENHGFSDAYAYMMLNDTERNWLSALPQHAEAQNGILSFHSTPSSDSTYLLETAGQILLLDLQAFMPYK